MTPVLMGFIPSDQLFRGMTAGTDTEDGHLVNIGLVWEYISFSKCGRNSSLGSAPIRSVVLKASTCPRR